MKILVTGARGQVGQEVVLRLQSMGWEVFAVGHAECDIAKADAINELMRHNAFSLVVNCAAYTAVDKAEEEYSVADAINSLGSKNLALATSRANIPLIHLSTDYIFDGRSQSPYRETDVPNPINVYGKTKLEGERHICATTTQYVILRTSWVFGQHGNNFVKSMIRLGKNRKELRIVDDQLGCPTAAGDIASAVTRIAESVEAGTAKYGIYHYCGNPAVTWYGFACRIFAMLSKENVEVPRLQPISTSEYPVKAARPCYSVLDCDKIASDYALAQPSWENSLAKVLNDLSDEWRS